MDLGQKLNFKKHYDLILVFGGDGSLLRTLAHLRHFETPLMLVNMGRLGFFSDAPASAYQKVVAALVKKEFTLEPRMLLRCSVVRNGRRVFSHRFLNEVTIARDALARMISLKTTVDDRKLTTYVADGLIISTPTGSTAYSLSAGGPIVSPLLDSIILTPISAHSFTQKPIVLPPSGKIKISIATGQERSYLTIDGQQGFHLRQGDVVKVKRSSKSLKLARLQKSSYFQTLRKKLQWGIDVAR